VDGTRWLDAQEQHAWRSYLAATHLLATRLDRELQRDSQIPHTYYEILVRLSEAPDRALRMSDLADASESSRSRLSHAVARLEKTGWVRRESCPTDRRGAFARLTDVGFEALAAAAPAHVESVRRHLFDRLTGEQVDQLAEICNAITTGLREEDPEAPPDEAASDEAASDEAAASDEIVSDEALPA
jgi:DNA-binding MarR family transcriptional regulator